MASSWLKHRKNLAITHDIISKLKCIVDIIIIITKLTMAVKIPFNFLCTYH